MVGNTRARAFFLIVLVSSLVVPTAARAYCIATEADMGIQFDVYRVADLQVTPVDFGSILINGQSGRLDMDSNGSLSFSGGVLHVSGFPQAGTLTLDGNSVMATITLDPQVDMGDGVTYTPIASATSVQLMGEPETIYIYGTIELPAQTPTKHYHGILHISVTYN